MQQSYAMTIPSECPLVAAGYTPHKTPEFTLALFLLCEQRPWASSTPHREWRLRVGYPEADMNVRAIPLREAI